MCTVSGPMSNISVLSEFNRRKLLSFTFLSNNNIKCGELFIGYSKINCITNYTITVKYCKLINCLA